MRCSIFKTSGRLAAASPAPDCAGASSGARAACSMCWKGASASA
jgi:hypothetical protein